MANQQHLPHRTVEAESGSCECESDGVSRAGETCPRCARRIRPSLPSTAAHPNSTGRWLVIGVVTAGLFIALIARRFRHLDAPLPATVPSTATAPSTVPSIAPDAQPPSG